jgi:hypothetical protein
MDPAVYERLYGKVDTDYCKNMIRAIWAAGAADSLVKVAPVGNLLQTAAGFATTIKFVVGRTPEDMETTLGFKADSKLVGGADIYAFTKLPANNEFQFAGYTHLPGGIPTDDPSYTKNPQYPPGRGAPQWIIATPLPVVLLVRVQPGQVFAYPLKSLPPRP